MVFTSDKILKKITQRCVMHYEKKRKTSTRFEIRNCVTWIRDFGTMLLRKFFLNWGYVISCMIKHTPSLGQLIAT